MNLEFIEGRETRDKVVKFGGVGITDEEIVNDKGKRGVRLYNGVVSGNVYTRNKRNL